MPTWRLRAPANSPRGSRTEVVEFSAPRLVSNDMSTLKRAAADGLGIVALPAYICRNELRNRELVHVLPGWLADESTFTALLPHRRGLLPAVRSFVDYLVRHLTKYVAT